MKTRSAFPLATVLAAAFVATACWPFGGGSEGPGAAPTPAAVPVPAAQQDVLGPVSQESRLYSDNTGGYADSARIVIRDGDAWTSAWDRATSHQADPLPRPAVDFGRNMVIVVSAGRMTPEDHIRVDSVGVRSVRTEAGSLEDVFEVVVRTVQGCGRLQVDAFPFEIIRTRRFEGEVRFVERRTVTEGCGGSP